MTLLPGEEREREGRGKAVCLSGPALSTIFPKKARIFMFTHCRLHSSSFSAPPEGLPPPSPLVVQKRGACMGEPFWVRVPPDGMHR